MVAALSRGANWGLPARRDSSAPHWARPYTGGRVTAASAVLVISGASRAVSAGLVPGSMRSSRRSDGAAPDRVTTSTWTPVLGPVHSGALPLRLSAPEGASGFSVASSTPIGVHSPQVPARSEEHTSELQSRQYLVCRLLLEKKT